MQNKTITTPLVFKGTVEKRLYNTILMANLFMKAGVVFSHELTAEFNQGLFRFDAILNEVSESGVLTKAQINQILELSAKKMFHANILWKITARLFGIDLKIPYITGYWSTKPIKENLVPTRGKRKAAELLGGTDVTPVTAIALGTGTNAAAAGDTALQTEITTNGGQRGAATVSNTTTTTTGDTEQWQKTFSFTGSFAVTEEGLLDNNSSGGVLLARQVFSAINVANGDSLQITHKIQVS